MAGLNPAQLLVLKADILADSSFNNQPHNSDGAFFIAQAYNLEAAGPFIVWRTNVDRDEIQQLAAFDWTLVDNLTVGKGRIWEWMFMRGAAINPSMVNVRAGIAACWVGSAPLVAVQTAILNQCKRNASRVEKLFAVGTGSTASPATMAVEGPIDFNVVVGAMGW